MMITSKLIVGTLVAAAVAVGCQKKEEEEKAAAEQATMALKGDQQQTQRVGTLEEPPKAAPATNAVIIEDAEIEFLPGARTATVYLRIVNNGTSADTLKTAKAAIAKGAALQDTTMDEGQSKIIPQPLGFPIPAGGELALVSGGKHIFLTEVTLPEPLPKEFDLELEFATAGVVNLKVRLREPAAAATERADKAAGGMDEPRDEPSMDKANATKPAAPNPAPAPAKPPAVPSP